MGQIIRIIRNVERAPYAASPYPTPAAFIICITPEYAWTYPWKLLRNLVVLFSTRSNLRTLFLTLFCRLMASCKYDWRSSSSSDADEPWRYFLPRGHNRLCTSRGKRLFVSHRAALWTLLRLIRRVYNRGQGNSYLVVSSSVASRYP